jgi:hypothetical protein
VVISWETRGKPAARVTKTTTAANRCQSPNQRFNANEHSTFTEKVPASIEKVAYPFLCKRDAGKKGGWILRLSTRKEGTPP